MSSNEHIHVLVKHETHLYGNPAVENWKATIKPGKTSIEFSVDVKPASGGPRPLFQNKSIETEHVPDHILEAVKEKLEIARTIV